MKNSPHQRVEEYLSKKYNFRYNEITGRVETKLQDSNTYSELNDYILHSLIRELKSKKMNISKKDLRQILYSDFVISYNPFVLYFSQLPSWNPTMDDYIDALADTVLVSEEDESTWRLYLKRWLIGAVACSISPKDINHSVLVFVGGQGIGKTTWLEKLTPPRLKNYYLADNINPNDKDSKISLSECFIINLDELESLNRHSLGSLKQLITQSTVRIRRPYSSAAETLPRRASFTGSVNVTEFLKDETGNRRFLCVEPLKIFNNAQIDINMVFAQAYYLHNIHERFWFDDEENKQINLFNERFKTQHIEMDIINTYFDVCNDNNPDVLMKISELREYLIGLGHPASELTLRRLGIVMKASNFKRTKPDGFWYYKLNNKQKEQN